MKQNTTRAGVLPAQVDATSEDSFHPVVSPVLTCRECSEQTGSGYGLCHDCLNSLPDGICPANVLDALS